jgi:hypothetical protein
LQRLRLRPFTDMLDNLLDWLDNFAIWRSLEKIIIVLFMTFIFGLGFGMGQVFYQGPNGNNYIDQYDKTKPFYDRQASQEYAKNDTVGRIYFRFNLGCAIGGIDGFGLGMSCKIERKSSNKSAKGS